MQTTENERGARSSAVTALFGGARRLRVWLRRLLRPKSTPKAEKPRVAGLPPGLTWESLEGICQSRLGASLESLEFQHLSGWKSHGAYRLHVRLAGGQQRSLIYKRALYDHTEIPALKGFPALPGPAEFVIYRLAVEHPSSRLSAYLPETYLADELEPGRLYNFLFEDIGGEYNRARMGAARIPVAPQIVDLHGALEELLPSPLPAVLIQYDLAYSRALRDYAHANLERYRAFTSEKEGALTKVLKRWDEIASLHEAGLHLPARHMGPIHGDLNFANVYVPNSGQGSFKALDWEWAGYGPVLMDLAALMKGALPDRIDQSLESYARADGCSSFEELRPVLYSCLLERSFNDAAYLAAHQMDGMGQARINVRQVITRALERTLALCQDLQDGKSGSGL